MEEVVFIIRTLFLCYMFSFMMPLSSFSSFGPSITTTLVHPSLQ